MTVSPRATTEEIVVTMTRTPPGRGPGESVIESRVSVVPPGSLRLLAESADFLPALSRASGVPLAAFGSAL
jgi:hypothetical protein